MADTLAPNGGVIRPPRVDTHTAPTWEDYYYNAPNAGNPAPTPGGFSGTASSGASPTAPGQGTKGDTSSYDNTVADPLGTLIQKRLSDLFTAPAGATASPNDTALQNTQKKISWLEDLQAASNSAATANDDRILEKKLAEMGLYAGPAPGVTREDTIRMMADKELANLPILQRQASQLGTNILAERAAGAGLRENELNQGLSTTGDLMSQLIDQRLREHLGDIGQQGNEVRSSLGANLAARGLNQSSFGAQRVAQSYLAEQQDRATAMTGAQKAKSNIWSAIDQTTQSIANNRREMANKQTLSQATTAEDVAFNIDSDALNSRFKQEVAQLELDAKSSGFLGSFLGGLAGSIGGFFVGGPAGAAVGWGVGSKVGGAL